MTEEENSTSSLTADNYYISYMSYKYGYNRYIAAVLQKGGMKLSHHGLNGHLKGEISFSSIRSALSSNNLEAIRALITLGIDVNMQIEDESLVAIAIKSNLPSMTELLVRSGAWLDNPRDKMSPLMLAIQLEYPTIVKTLLDLGVDKEEGRVGLEIIPSLQFASSLLNVKIVKLLLNKGVNVQARQKTCGCTALHTAVNYEGKYSGEKMHQMQAKVVKLLLENGAEANLRDCQGRTPLDAAIFFENTVVCEVLLKHGVGVMGDHSGDGGVTQFEYLVSFAAFKSPRLIDLCLERGGDYRFRDGEGLTAYHFALANGDAESVRVFWRHGCPLDQGIGLPGQLPWINPMKCFRCYNHLLAIQCMFIDGMRHSRLDMVETALAEGAEVKGCSVLMPSPLHFLNDAKIAKTLLERGVAVNRLNRRGQTPLYVAVEKRQISLTLLLLRFGACVDCKPRYGVRLKHLVKACPAENEILKQVYKAFRLARRGEMRVFLILRKFSSPHTHSSSLLASFMNCVDGRGFTLTTLALRMGHFEMAEKLMNLRIVALNNTETFC